MYRIPVINQSTLFEDIDRNALVQGKIEVLDPVSNNPLTIWSYSDDEYTVMTNPVILDIEGRVPQTVFCDRIVYCRVYAFKGYDEYNQPIYEFIRDFYAGENENSESREYVVGLEALKDLDPTINSSVNVLGYFTAYDCPMRQYVWDANCTQDADNGYIVASDVSATGRWILIFSGEYLPSSYYGVYPGKLANINALLSYVEYVGTASTKTAPGVWFVPGNYDVETNLQTTKRVLLDAGTSFACQYFYCGNLKVIGEPQVSICDFDFYDPEQEAHSSWFRTVFGFLTSGAKKYILDARDNFLNHNLQGAVTLQNKIIEGQTRLPITYSGSGKISFSNCVINAERIFNSTDILGFSYMEIHDHWWSNPAEIDFYNKVTAHTSSINSLVIDNFTNMTAFVNAMGANGEQVLDMAGRSIYNLELPASVVELRNVHVTNFANIQASGRDITVRNCHLDNADVTCRYLSVYDSRINFYMEPIVSAMWGNNSEIISSSNFVNKAIQYIFEDCKVGINFKRVTDNTARDAFLDFIRCNFENCVIESKTLTMKNCDCDGCTIKIYPYKENDIYKMYCYLEGNRFISGTPIEFTKVDIIDGGYQDNVYDVQVSWSIMNNFFAGNSEGLRCRYWQHRTGSNYGKTFIATRSNLFNVAYEGNTGNCPGTDMRGVSISNNQGYVKETVAFGTGTVDIYKYDFAHKRVMPTGDDGYWWWQSVKGPNILMKYYSWINDPYNSLTYDMFIHTNWELYPVSHDDHIDNGDFFDMAILSRNDYIRIVQQGDGDRNQGVDAIVI